MSSSSKTASKPQKTSKAEKTGADSPDAGQKTGFFRSIAERSAMRVAVRRFRAIRAAAARALSALFAAIRSVKIQSVKRQAAPKTPAATEQSAEVRSAERQTPKTRSATGRASVQKAAAFLQQILKHPSTALFSALVFLILLDQTLKTLFLFFNLKTGSFLGFSVELFANKDFILSWNPALGAFFNSLILTPVFVWIVFLYFLSVHYIPVQMKAVRYGWTAAAAGALANMSDKLRLGYVLDIFAFRPSDSFVLYFNLADIILTAGAFSLIAAGAGFLFRGKPERRKKLLSLKKEQTEFVLAVIWVSLCFSLLFLIATRQFFTQYLALSENAQPAFLSFALKYFGVATVSFLIPVWAAFFYISHKIYGPIYAFERYVRALIRKESPADLRLRKGDQLKRLEILAKEIKDSMDNQP